MVKNNDFSTDSFNNISKNPRKNIDKNQNENDSTCQNDSFTNISKNSQNTSSATHKSDESQIIDSCSFLLKQVPSLGTKSAKRIVLHLAKNKEYLSKLIIALEDLKNKITQCTICHNISTTQTCSICAGENRNKNLICVVESVEDILSIEKCQNYNGTYHVLGGSISLINNIKPEDLNISSLILRISNAFSLNDEQRIEIIFANNTGVNSQITTFYIADKIKALNNHNIVMTELAKGIPIGYNLDYLDEGTMNAAIQKRISIE